jgi:hypothetical protein
MKRSPTAFERQSLLRLPRGHFEAKLDVPGAQQRLRLQLGGVLSQEPSPITALPPLLYPSYTGQNFLQHNNTPQAPSSANITFILLFFVCLLFMASEKII